MQTLETVLKYIFGIFFILAGANHFYNPAMYLRIMPPYLPAHSLLVQLSGVAEIVLGALLLVPRFQRLAAWGLIALLLAVFPANVYMAQHPECFPDIAPALIYLRLPLQFLLIAWAYRYTRP